MGSRSLRMVEDAKNTATIEYEHNNNNDNNKNWPIKSKPEGRKIVWLMSFPNSGTSFTSRLVRDATKTDSASNYADETPTGAAGLRMPVFEDQPDGPFWIKPEASPEFSEPSEYVITKVRWSYWGVCLRCKKGVGQRSMRGSLAFLTLRLATHLQKQTHCGIRCTMCPPEKYAESSYSFRRNCLKTKWMHVDEAAGINERVFSQYPPDRLTKAIHLIRDPFDNIVSRYHLERQLPGREAAKYPKTREGFRSYCAAIDNLHRANEKRTLFLDDDLLEIMQVVPCHADFFRYIEWHNLAFVTTRDLELDTYVLQYDWYTTRFNETATELLEFLHLPIHEKGELTPFVPGKVYPYFTNNEKRAVQKAFEIMASPVTWKRVKHYFNDIGSNADADELTDNKLDPQGKSFSTDVALKTPQESSRPPLSSLVLKDSQTEIIGDVQFLMDFAIVGYPKTATSTKVRWLAKHSEIQMYDHEIYHMKDGQPANMVRTLYALPEGDQFKRGYKAPRDIHNPRALDSFTKYWPKTKFIVGLRHPVLWFESFYNFRIRFNFTLPSPGDLMGDCPPGAHNVCTEEIRYNDHLSLLGKTDRTDPEELKLLSPLLPRHRKLPKLENPVFLYEISQMHDSDESRSAQYRADLQQYLGLQEPLEPLAESKESHGDHPNKDLEIDICSPKLSSVHAELMQIARDSSIWIRNYFLQLPEVYVSSPDHFDELLENWMVDPCVSRANTIITLQGPQQALVANS